MNEKAEHWNRIYTQVPDIFLGWYEQEPLPGADLIEAHAPNDYSELLIAGGGTTNLIDRLLSESKHHLTFVDLSEKAIQKNQERLPESGHQVDWICQDLSSPLPNSLDSKIDLWYDRAVLHFILEEADLNVYIDNIIRVLKPKGKVIIGVFSENTASVCSGLPIQNYSVERMDQLFEKAFDRIESFNHEYTMPSGSIREYLWSVYQKK